MPFHLAASLLANPIKAISLLALLLAGLPARGQVGTAVRELPYDFHPGDLVEVRIQVTPPVGSTNWSVRELYTNRWELISATNASSTNEFIGELIFGPFTNGTPRTLAYKVLSNPGYTNSVTFAGTFTNNGASSPIAGTTFLPARNEWIFAGPQSLFGSQQASSVSGTAFGAGRWLAGVQGWITTFESGGRLTYPRCVRNYANSRLAYVGGLFLQFGNTPGTLEPLMTVSNDGISWKVAVNERGSPNPFVNGRQLNAAAYGSNGTYVAVGDQWFAGEQAGGAILSSTNGYNWRRVKRVENPWRPVNAVAFANGRFMAVADLGTLLTSTNGLEWTEVRPIPVVGDIAGVWTNRNLLGICHGPAGWIIPTSLAGTRLQSADGVVWNERTGNNIPSAQYWQSFYADDKYWFSGTSAAYTTVDGATWSSPSLSSPQPNGVVARAPDGVSPQYVAAGASAASVVVSTNGANWTTAALGSSFQVGWPRYLSVAAANNEWVVSGQSTTSSGSPSPNDRPERTSFWVPALTGSLLDIRDGHSHWRSGFAGAYADFLVTSNGLLGISGARNQLSAGFLNGTNYVFSPSGNLPSLGRAVATQYYIPGHLNPQSWEWVRASLAQTPDGIELFAETFTYTGPRITWGHFTSTNGSNWTRRAEGLNHATNFPAIRGLAWGAGRFVAVSEGRSPGPTADITNANRIYTSTNGNDYQPVDLSALDSPLHEGLTGVAFANGKFVAIGNQGRILCSTNGLDWVTARPSDGHRWNRVRYLDGVWGVVGNVGWIAFSLDGLTWSSRTVGAESDLTDIAQQNAQYMLVGSHAMVLLSLPVTPAQIFSDSMTKLPGAGLQFNVSGHPGKLLDIQVGSTLTNWTSLLRRTNTTGTAVITDSEPSSGFRFYRAVQLP